ncbi:MAG: FadR family transcriptional regulator [Planctomycetes bacterium]|nr:FadR family transcriptional regulator [Planctomycetota bacterium]
MKRAEFPSLVRIERNTQVGTTSQLPGGFDRLQQVDLVKEIVQQLRSRILSGHFGQNGELPTESQLGTSFGVSRTVAREAMRTLRAQGLVEVSRGRRPRVCPMDPQVAIDSLQALLVRSVASLHHLFEIRRPLELEIATLAADRATEADMQALQDAIDEQLESKSVKKQMDCDRRFHELLANSTGNTLFQTLLSTIAPLLNASRRTTLSRVGAGRAIEGHVAILQALRNRDSVEAHKAMALHLAMAEEDLGQSSLQVEPTEN